MNASLRGIAISALPSALMLGLFYSLAIHMHHALGGWPASIGERGFPPTLVTHATLTVDFCIGFVLSTVFVMPIAILTCSLVQRWRHLAPYFAFHGLLSIACWGLMQLAPAQFLYWWWDCRR